ncbi:alpha/beta fold hydrolase [Streptomyces rishiriensis]|uniref:alpha/beta fold hydrolase n=1 Tax=Streptomyces rishiriensis TaxID=68264 RepID=UPI0033C05247
MLPHGWPESRYSWRHQFGAPAAAGYRVVAPGQRGYAGSHPLSRHGRRKTTFGRTRRTSSCRPSGRSSGAFDWRRNIERNNELLIPFRGLGIAGPALYVVGDRDLVTVLRSPGGGSSQSEIFRGQGESDNPLSAAAPQLHGPLVLPGCGHRTRKGVPPRSTPHSSTSLNRTDGSASR